LHDLAYGRPRTVERSGLVFIYISIYLYLYDSIDLGCDHNLGEPPNGTEKCARSS